MNLSHQTHPTREELAAHLAGKLNAVESDQIEQHLAECESCCEILNLLPNDDTVVNILRQPTADTSIASDVQPALPETIAPDMGEETRPPRGAPTQFDDSSAARLELPPELRDHPRYRIVELLGHGGMGDVYRAEHKVMNRQVALKVIKPQLVQNDAAVRRFQREVQAAASLRHPNIVTAHDAEQAGDLHYLVMEFVDGVDLDEVVRERGPLPVDEACDYIRQAAEGLQHANDLGMVHRDIKPHNLMIEKHSRTIGGDTVVVKILDFGLANFANEVAEDELKHVDRADDAHTIQNAVPGASILHQLTQMGTMMGTPDYIAPEQAEDAHSADIRADIYSLGCTFYTLLTGNAPFGEGSVLDKIKAHTEEDAPPLADFRDDVPPAVEAVMLKMMAKDPAERYQTPADVASALSSVAASFQLAKAEEKVRQAGSSSPRRRRPLVLTAVATLFLALLAAAATIVYIQTDNGVVRVEVTDPSLAVTIAGQTITMDDGEKPLTIRAGEQQLIVRQKDSDFELVTDSFQLHRGDDIVLKVDLLPGEVVVSKEDGTRLGAKSLPQDQLASREWARLAGRWRAVTWESASRVLKPEDVANFELVVDAEQRTMTFDVHNDTPELTKADLEPSATPKRIDLRYDFGLKDQDAKTTLGIYRLDADELTICLAYPGSPRPDEFKFVSNPGLRRQLFVLQRVGTEPLGKPSDLLELLALMELDEAVRELGGKADPPIDVVRNAKKSRPQPSEIRFDAVVTGGGDAGPGLLAELEKWLPQAAAVKKAKIEHVGRHDQEKKWERFLSYHTDERTGLIHVTLVDIGGTEKTRVWRLNIDVDEWPRSQRPSREHATLIVFGLANFIGSGPDPSYVSIEAPGLSISSELLKQKLPSGEFVDSTFLPSQLQEAVKKNPGLPVVLDVRPEIDPNEPGMAAHIARVRGIVEAEGAFVRLGPGLAKRTTPLPESVGPLNPAEEPITLVRELTPYEPGHGMWIDDVVWPSEGRVMARGGSGEVRIWDPESGEMLESFRATGAGGAFSADGRFIATINQPDLPPEVHLWDSRGKRVWVRSFESGVSRVEFCASGLLVTLEEQRGAVVLLSLEDGQEARRFVADTEGAFKGNVTMSSDGEQLLLPGAGDESRAKLLKVADGSQLAELESSDKVYLKSPLWSADGRYLLAGSKEGNIFVWDANSGRLLRQWQADPRGASSIAFSSPNTVVAGGASRITAWDWSTGKLLAVVDTPDLAARHIAISPDGKQLISGGGSYSFDSGLQRSNDYTPRIWQLPETVWPEKEVELSGAATQWTLLKKLRNPRSDKSRRQVPASGHGSLAVAANGYQVFSAEGAAGEAKLWSVKTVPRIIRTQLGAKSAVENVALSSSGRYGAAAESIGVLYVWDLLTGDFKHVLDNGDANGDGSSAVIAFSPDDSLLLAASDKGAATVWNVATGKAVARHNFAGFCWDGLILPDNTTAVITSGEKVHYWNLQTNVVETKCSTDGVCSSLTISADGRTLITGSDHDDQPVVQVWDTTTWKEQQRFVGHTQAVTSVEFLGGDRYIISGGTDGRIILWDRQTGKEVARKEGLGHLANSVRPVLDGLHVVSLGNRYDGEAPNPMEGDYDLRLWRLVEKDPEALESVSPPEELVLQRKLGPTEITAVPAAIAASADGRWLISAEGKSARLWDASTGKPVFTMPVADDHQAGSVAISRDGKWAAVFAAETNGKSHVELWNLAERKKGRQLDLPHNHHIVMAFSADGRRLVTGGQFGRPDETTPAFVWETATGEQIHSHVFQNGFAVDCKAVPGTSDVILGVATAGDTNSGLLTGGTLWRWNVESGQLNRPAGFPDSGHGFDVSSDGARAAVVAVETTGLNPIRQTYSIEVRDLQTGELVQRLETGVNERPAPAFVCFLAGDRFLAAGYLLGPNDQSDNGAIRVWDVQTGRLVAHRPNSGKWMYTSLAAFANGRLAAFGPRDFEKPIENDIEIWQLPESVWPKKQED